MIFDMLEYYNMVKENNIGIIYSGPLWADSIEGIGETLRKRMEFEEMSLSASQSVFSVFVEQMNNMLMYSEDKYEGMRNNGGFVSSGIFILGAKEKMYFVQSGNVMRNENIELVRGRIDYLNTLDKKELRQYYKTQIKAENLNPESKGAGLGLIEIARRASSPITYSFAPYDQGLTFFSMFVTIG